MTNFTTTALIHDIRLPALTKQLQKLSALAVKLGLPAYKVEHGETKLLPHPLNKNIMHHYVELTVTGQRPVLTGNWTVMAKLEHAATGNIVKGFRADELDTKYRSVAAACEHCNTKRNRKHTYVLHNAAGEAMQVASTCLADFVGHDNPKELLQLLDGLALLPESLNFEPAPYDPEAEQGGFGASYAAVDVKGALVVACELVAREGYISRDAAYEKKIPSTADEVAYHLLKGSRLKVSKDAQAKALKVIEWAKDLKESSSTYLYNLSALVNSDGVTFKNLGLLVSSVAAYDRDMRETKEKPAQADVYMGSVDDKFASRLVTYNGMGSSEGYWGWTYFLRFTDQETGAALVWKTSSPLSFSQGCEYRISGTIKAHSLYQDKKQTEIIRVRCSDLAVFDKLSELLKGAINGQDAKDVTRQAKALAKKIQNPNTVNRDGEGFLFTVLHVIDDSDKGWEPIVEALLAVGCNPAAHPAGIKDLANGSKRALKLLKAAAKA